MNSGCGVIVFNNKLETIIVESKKSKNNYSFPKGRKNFPEESDFDCAIRELQEETGLTLNQITILNNEQIFMTESIKNHKIGYYLAIFKGNNDFKFTFDSDELQKSPYWANKKYVLSKFYGGPRREIYESAYKYVSGYFCGKEVKIETQPVSILKKSFSSLLKNSINPTEEQHDTTEQLKCQKSYLTNDQCVKIGKTLSWLLRHGLKERNISMRNDAYVLLDDVLLQKEFSSLNIKDIEYIVNTNSKKRYTLLNENGIFYIKANQGHSSNIGEQIDQTHAFTIITRPLEKCIHGTDRKAWELIRTTGLNKMSRQHIHFAISEPSDKNVISGARSSSTIFIYVNMEKAMNDGIVFYMSENGVVLSEGIDGVIDKKYFSKVIDKNGKACY